VDDLTRLLAGGTLISWAHYTFNPWRGCVKVSPACRFCYAERETARWGGDFWGKNADRPIAKTTWRDPRKWNREAQAAGERRRVFSGSLCDVFEDRPDLVDARARLFDLIEATPWLIWMLLTKRPENIGRLAERYAIGWPSNIWLGCSAENQRFANERIPHLVLHDVPVRFVSCEPLLGDVNLCRIPMPGGENQGIVYDTLGKRFGVPGAWSEPMSRGIDWVITGGESGTKPGIRPSHPGWYRRLRDQATSRGVAFHHKQNGMWVGYTQLAEMPERYVGHDWAVHPARHRMLALDGRSIPVDQLTGREDPADGWTHMLRMAKKTDSGRLLDDQLWNEFPEEARRVPA
jgi:protein gp37